MIIGFFFLATFGFVYACVAWSLLGSRACLLAPAWLVEVC